MRVVLQAGAHKAHVQAWADTHTHTLSVHFWGRNGDTGQCLQAEVPPQPQPCPGAQQPQQQLHSSLCVEQNDSARNSCSNAHLLQTLKDELLVASSTLATRKWH